MDAKFDELLRTDIITKCKVSIACAFQEEQNQPIMFDKYELAYIIEKLRSSP